MPPIVMVTTEVDSSASAALAAAMQLSGRDIALDIRGPLPLNALAPLGHELADRWGSAPPAAVVAHGWQAGLALQIALKERPIPVVQRFTNLASRSSDTKRARVESALARGANRVVASSGAQVEQLVSLGVRRPNIRVVPYGVDISVFMEAGPTWSKSAKKRLVAASASCEPAFLAALINALPSLHDAELVIIGLVDNEPAGEALLQHATRRGLADRVKLVGELPASGRAALLRSCDLAISSTAEDSAAAFVLQAMACGVPVAARAVGPAADAVADGVTGVLVRPGRPELLAEAVRGILSDGLRRETFGLAAVDRARARFNWTVAAAAMGRILDEVTAAEQVVTLPRQETVVCDASATIGN